MTTSDSSRTPLIERTAFRANKSAQLLMERIEQGLAELGLHSRTYFVLAGVEGDVPRSQQELSKLLTIDTSTMVALVDELERKGLVTRTRNERDRRRYDLALSEKGVSTLSAAHDALEAAEEDFFSPLNNKQRAVLHDLLGQLIAGRWP